METGRRNEGDLTAFGAKQRPPLYEAIHCGFGCKGQGTSGPDLPSKYNRGGGGGGECQASS